MDPERFQDSRDAYFRIVCELIGGRIPITSMGSKTKDMTWHARLAVGAKDVLRAMDWAWSSRPPEDAPAERRADEEAF